MYLILLFLTVVNGYSFKVHTFMGNLLAEHLDKFPIISKNEFGNVSTWADSVRHQRPWSAQYHYIDIMECNSTNLIEYCKEDCIYTAILNYTNDLHTNYNYMSNNERIESLKFLLHFTQDLFQPMHIYGIYNGGNRYHIYLKYYNKLLQTNLHSLWDNYIPMKYINEMTETIRLNLTDKSFKAMRDVQKELEDIIYTMLDMICSKPLAHVINFLSYYEEGEMRRMFEMYIRFATKIYNFVVQSI